MGILETRTPDEVEKVLNESTGPVLVVVNSVCGCAAANARPGISVAMGHSKLPEKYFSLSELSGSIQTILRKTYSKGYWIKAEIAKVNYYEKSGHCYPDLVEKKDSKILAQMRGIIWANDFVRITTIFKEKTGEELKEGMEILFFCQVEYSPVHGLSLIISDISPEFSLGNMLIERMSQIRNSIYIMTRRMLPYYNDNGCKGPFRIYRNNNNRKNECAIRRPDSGSAYQTK